MREYRDRKQVMTDKIRQTLVYTGTILTVVFAIVNIILLAILIVGFQAKLELNQLLFLAIVQAVFSIAIISSLMYQGIAFAKDYEDNKVIMNAWEELSNGRKKEDKIRTISHYVVSSTIKNVLLKGGMVFLTTYSMISIAIMGMNDITILWIGLANILMSVGFGMLSLVGAFDFYIDKHIPAIKVKINKLKEAQNATNK